MNLADRLVRLDTKKGETVYIHKTKKRFYILNTILYHLYTTMMIDSFLVRITTMSIRMC